MRIPLLSCCLSSQFSQPKGGRRRIGGGRSFDAEMELQDRIEIVGTDALAGSKGLREPGGLPREGLLDSEFASQDVAMHNKSAGAGSPRAGAGHGEFSGVAFGEIAKNRHSTY